ncbi:MAG: adenylosuccinate lyase, partial [Candidatus Mcinerneyibacterium aminivorans]
MEDVMGNLKAIGVFDGRYNKYVNEFEEIFSEFGLMKRRVQVEIKWLFFLSRELKLFEIDKDIVESINNIYKKFDIKDAKHIKEIEKTTNHDVKAVEYFIKEKLDKVGASEIKEWVHFACTSEDINNNSYALMLKEGKNIISKALEQNIKKLEEFGKKYKDVSMISRTHGQPASPTTAGKEFINFAFRLKKEYEKLNRHEVEGKMNGASGNFNAHQFVFDNVDWISKSSEFIDNYLKIKPLIFSTQINNYSYISELLHILIRIASIVIDIDRDIWGYISFDYLKQKVVKGEVGSSTMPHKVNPIDFENS